MLKFDLTSEGPGLDAITIREEFSRKMVLARTSHNHHTTHNTLQLIAKLLRVLNPWLFLLYLIFLINYTILFYIFQVDVMRDPGLPGRIRLD